MNYRAKIATTLAAAMTALSANAQSLDKAVVRAEPLQYTKDGKFRGCGLNLKLLEDGTTPTLDYISVSVNFWLDKPGFALVKTQLKKATMSAGTVKPAGLDRSWARIAGQDPLNQQNFMAGEELAILSTVEINAGMDFIAEVMRSQKEVQVGFFSKGSKLERTFRGIPAWDADGRAALSACFTEFTTRLQATP